MVHLFESQQKENELLLMFMNLDIELLNHDHYYFVTMTLPIHKNLDYLFRFFY